MTLDENGNLIIEDENNEEGIQQDETDYKTLYEEAQAKADKYEGRFKKTAKELNEMKKSDSPTGNVAEIVSKQVAEEMYYANNPVAKEYQKEIKEIQAKTGMNPEDAMTFYIAKNKPELIGKESSMGIDGVSRVVEPKKDYKDMTYEELWDKNAGK